MLTDQELQSLRNLGNEAEAAADLLVACRAVGIRQEQTIMDQEREIDRLRAALKQCADAIEWNEGKMPHNLSTIGRAYWRARWMSAA